MNPLQFAGQKERPLLSLDLFKSLPGKAGEENWDFAGVASDESVDVQGDTILRKSLDVSYAKARGYVNWDHKRGPEDQLGYLKDAVVITDENRGQIEDRVGLTLRKSASMYVEGALYPHVKKAQEVQAILKSANGSVPGLGLSVDGVVARDKTAGDIIKAFVRGVAITPAPVHTLTMVQLKKSLQEYTEEAPPTGEGLQDLVKIAVRQELAKAMPQSRLLSYDEAVLWVLRQRPSWNYDLATKLVRFTMQSRSAP
jgi:hypothetical protein